MNNNNIQIIFKLSTNRTNNILYSMNVWQRKTLANFPSESFGKFPIRKFWQVKLSNFCLFALFMSRDIFKTWIAIFGELLVIYQIHQGFPLPNIHAVW